MITETVKSSNLELLLNAVHLAPQSVHNALSMSQHDGLHILQCLALPEVLHNTANMMTHRYTVICSLQRNRVTTIFSLFAFVNLVTVTNVTVLLDELMKTNIMYSTEGA